MQKKELLKATNPINWQTKKGSDPFKITHSHSAKRGQTPLKSLLLAIGCNVVEGSGSSVMFEKNGRRAYFHRPHPQREALVYRIKAVREFLLKLEITP